MSVCRCAWKMIQWKVVMTKANRDLTKSQRKKLKRNYMEYINGNAIKNNKAI
jgi:hypothetical protein